MKIYFKIITILFFSISTNNLLSQTNFYYGFLDGYKIGYCFDQDFNCISPTPPLPPMCKLGESSSSYNDGYNRGLLDGTMARTNKQNHGYNSIDVYAQPQIIPEFQRYKPDFSFYEKSIRQNQINQQSRNLNNEFELKKEKVLGKVSDYLSSDKASLRKSYINLLKQYYNDFNVYPKYIPDGNYNVIITSEPQAGFESISPTFENAEVTVQSNKITLIKTVNQFSDGLDFSYMYSIEKYPEIVKKTSIGITECVFDNGISTIKYKVFIEGSTDTYPGEYKRVYFMDYILKYQNTQLCIKEIKDKHIVAKKSPVLKNGWNNAYVNDGETFCELRKVFIENNKITIYKENDGKEYILTNGGVIYNGSTSFAYLNSQSSKIILEAFFF